MSKATKKSKTTLSDDFSLSSASIISEDADVDKTKNTIASKKDPVKSAASEKPKLSTALPSRNEALNDDAENDSFDVVIPPSLGTSTYGECTLMIEVNPDDAAVLDYEGVSGAIGRFEANNQGVVVDLKGNRYQGSIVPGPTALVVGFAKGGRLRVEGITDEFATLAKTHDVMASFNAVVQGEFDDGFRVQDDNVNKTKSAEAKQKLEAGKMATGNDRKKNGKRSTASSAKSNVKKRK
eukprot:scaffold18525_cov190-Cylindrotheca_fusiformis.AAC.3